MRRFWVAGCEEGREVELPASESRHAARSLRLDAGATVVLFDGAGREWDGTVSRREAGRILVRVGTSRSVRAAASYSIAVALPKGARADWMVEKLAELGVAEILPVRFRRSSVPLTEARRARMERLALAAAKQSGRATLPVIGGELDVEGLLGRVGPLTRLALPAADRPLTRALPATLVVIGPEGGLTPDEERLLASAGAVPVSLGPHVLRIETAALAAAAVLTQQ